MGNEEMLPFGSGAQGETRTPTYISTLAPEASASTNSATWAEEGAKITE